MSILHKETRELQAEIQTMLRELDIHKVNAGTILFGFCESWTKSLRLLQEPRRRCSLQRLANRSLALDGTTVLLRLDRLQVSL